MKHPGGMNPSRVLHFYAVCYGVTVQVSANSTTNLASVAAMASWSLFSKFVFCSILMTWNFTVDGSTKMPNGHMDAIEPYDYRVFQPFSTAYLPGYMADKYDEDADTCQARAHSRMQNSVSSELSASTLSAFAEMPLVMDTYTHTTETETYDPVKDNSSSSGSSTDSDGFGGSSGGKF